MSINKVKVTYIVSDIDKAIAFEWIVERINRHIELSFILINNGDSYLENYLNEHKIKNKRISAPKKTSFPSAIIQTYRFLKHMNPDVIHCHLRNANIIGLSAGKLARIKTRIYTRHHSTYHHEFYPKAVKIDALCNRLSTKIIAISMNVRNVLIKLENVSPEKIELIHHGFDLKSFRISKPGSVDLLKNKYELNNTGLTIGVVSRFIHLKGINYIVEAFSKLLTKEPNAHIIFANASGPDYQEIKNNIIKNIPKENYTEIKFENDLFSLYHLFDIYIHTPINEQIEAFGQTYIEAMASATPMICTVSGVGVEIVKNDFNALAVPFKSSDAIYSGIEKLVDNPELQTKLVKNGLDSIKDFELKKFIDKLNKLYLNG